MHWMILPYRRYFDFSGRSRRLEYWWFCVFLAAVVVAFMIAFFAAVFGTLGSAMANPESMLRAFGPGLWAAVTLLGLFFLASLIPIVAVQVRRLHDLGVSGWWYLAYIVGGVVLPEVPTVGEGLNGLLALGWIVWMFFPGTKGPNKYGDDPKNPQNLGTVFA